MPHVARATAAAGGSAAARRPPLTLVLEASTAHGSVAVVSDNAVVAQIAVATGRSQHEHLMPAVAAVLEQAGIGVADLSRVVCGSGPGSFTSLRIAAAVGKGLVSRAGGPRLASVPSLLLIVAGAADGLADGAYIPSIDALRGERHAALVTVVRDKSAPGPDAHADADADVDADRAAAPVIVMTRPARRLSTEAVHEWARSAGATMIGPECPVRAWPAAIGVLRVWDAVRDADVGSWEPDYGRLAEAEARRVAQASPDRASGASA